MEKIKFPKEEFPKEKEELTPAPEGKLTSAVAGFASRIFGILKFILGVCSLPIVYASSQGFLSELSQVTKPLQDAFWGGVITMLLVYLFVWEPVVVYTKGQKILEFIFRFLKPLVRVAPYLLPIYTLLIFAVLVPLAYFFKDLTWYAVFLIGLTITLHLIFSAKTMRVKKGDFLKGNYLFGFSLVYIINLMLLSFGLSIMFDKFSFVNFCNHSFQIAKGIISAAFTQLFL